MRPGAVGEYEIWVVRPNGTGLRRLTESPANRSDYNPAWSPDSSTLLFERRKLEPGAAGGDETLYAVNADGGGFRQITHSGYSRGDAIAEPALRSSAWDSPAVSACLAVISPYDTGCPPSII